tara:strand:+ start:80 stop:460 length:381 start_codon:yes stop_codon:yes gene_type:complete
LEGRRGQADIAEKAAPTQRPAAPDPLVTVTPELRAWFDEDRSQTGRNLLSKLQTAHPGAYPDGLLRTVQRRLKIWRADVARELVFGTTQGGPQPAAPDALRDTGAFAHQGPTQSAFAGRDPPGTFG